MAERFEMFAKWHIMSYKKQNNLVWEIANIKNVKIGVFQRLKYKRP